VSASRPLNLDLLLGKTKNAYSARVLRSPAGEGQLTTFPPPFTHKEVERLAVEMSATRRRARRIEAASLAAAKRFGARLFGAIFAGPVGECLRCSLDRARSEDAPLRIRLQLSDCPELAGLPWELLYDGDDDAFVALSGSTPVIRYVQSPTQPRELRVSLPLRVLVIVSEPIDHPKLDLQAGWAQLTAALEELTDGGGVALTQLRLPTLGELRRTLVRGGFHVLHFMGPGGFAKHDGATLLFTDEQGRGAPVTGERLGVILRDHASLRLAVLDTRHASSTDPAGPLAGVADALVRRGMPAVLATQFEIDDHAAVELAPTLYGALAAGRPLDMALADARMAIYTVSQTEWAAPALHLRTDDAQLFEIAADTPPGAGASASKVDATAQARWADGLCRQRRFADAETAYRCAIELEATLAGAHRGLAWALCGLERYPEAEAAGRAAIALAPADALTHVHLGVALLAQQRDAEAESACRDAIRLEAADPRAHYLLSAVLTAARRYDEAQSAAWEAVRVSPYSVALQENLRLLVRESPT